MKRELEITMSAIGWLALIAQLYIILSVRSAGGESLWLGVVNFFSFFTILTNIGVAKAVSLPLVLPDSRVGRFFRSPIVLGALAVYIFIVGMIYLLVLRKIWDPEGLQLWADVALHYVTPVLFLLYWFIFVPKKQLKWWDSLVWLVPPFLYVVYSLVRGSFTGYYPYPFLDVGEIGGARVLYNSAGISLLFWLVGILVIAIDRRSQRG